MRYDYVHSESRYGGIARKRAPRILAKKPRSRRLATKRAGFHNDNLTAVGRPTGTASDDAFLVRGLGLSLVQIFHPEPRAQ